MKSTFVLTLCLLCLLETLHAADGQQVEKPNILVILADDLGYADLGCYGNRYHQTPHIDRLLAAGMRFTQAYSDAPLCAPSRIALLSGRHATRQGCYEVVAGRFLEQVDIERVPLMPPENRLQLPAGRKILPERLRALGYRTGVFGKWHVGPQTPAQRGFDDCVLLGTASHLDAAKAATKQRSPDYPEPRGYSSDYLTACARRFLDKGQGDARPFFLYLPFTLVHTCIGPGTQLLEPQPELLAKYAALPTSELHRNPSYAAMVESLDQSVGEVIAELERRQLLSDTIVILTSDNGGLLGKPRRTASGIEAGDFTSNHPLRDGKATLWEGGIRIPFGIRFDGRIPAGRVSDAFVSQLDLMPTLLDLAGDPESGSAANGFDGRSLLPLFSDKPAAWPERALCWHYPNYRARGCGRLEGEAAPGGQPPSSAIRRGDWKLIESLEDGSCQLYNLAADVSEQRDLSRTHLERVAQLRGELSAWRAATRAPMPVRKELRGVISLDGDWRIVFDRTNEGRAQAWWQPGALDAQPSRPIHVPGCWEEIEQDYEGVAWYQRRFAAPAEWKGRAVRLQFDAANYFSEVWVNGQPVGDHEGGYTPFEFGVTDLLAYGQENMLTVRVVGPAIRSERVDFLLRDEAPHWRGGYVGGIWQSVRLTAIQPVFTRDVFVQPGIARSEARVQVTVENITLQPAAVEVTVSVGATQLREPLTVPPGGLTREFDLAIPDARLWSPDSPHLYTARVVIAANDKVLDEHNVRFGMREFTVRDGRFHLNGKPLFVKGAFWEGQYPSTLAHPKHPDLVRREIRMAKAAGFNLLRPWRMPPVPMILDLADEMGILLTGAPPIECMNRWPVLTPQLERRWTREMEQMVRRDRNHPSVILWETGNEVVRRELYLLRHKVSLAARRLDPTRLVIDESGGDSWSYGGHEARKHPDAFDGLTFARGSHFYLPGSTAPQRFEDHHIYLPAPVNGKDLQRIAKVGADTLPAWISEFGYGGFPDLPRNMARYRCEGNPLAPDYRFHERLLASLERVMEEHRLRELFPDASALCQASQQIQADGNKLQIEAIRLNPRAGGYCLHAFTDGDWVLGAGVLDMWREPKRLYPSVQEANQPLALAVRAAPQNIYAEKGARVAVTAIHEGAATEADLLVTLEGGSWQIRREVKLGTGIAELLDEPLPTASLRGPQTIHARLVQGERLLAENRHGIFIVGREQLAPGVATVTVFDPQNKVAPFLERLGVTARPLEAGSAPEGPVIVAYAAPREEPGVKKLAALLRHVQEGATAIWLDIPPAGHSLVTSNAFPFVPNRQPAKGMWIPVNHYIRPHPLFDGLAAGGFMGQVYQNVVPQFTLRDLPGAPLAGCVSWDHNKDYTGPAEVWHGTDLAVVPHGRGWLVLSTFNLVAHLGTDPVADRLLLNLCRWPAAEMKRSETPQQRP